ncbi:response regulator transcription factor [Microbacterium saccharophilum]|uniref:Response regulator transcription factor n=1 Tax=Microbacterium saccharophilum TaxID=1213358 RepID=A0A5C8IAQ3_9MICO|nr:response regulator transcription factor [Microbacterium saccharophilum]TXK15422.1 response regulator transcription factor [Microbacterium saccharophilum]
MTRDQLAESEEPIKTAVIVEDDPEVRHLLIDVLESAGFSTVSVGNGIDGVRAVAQYAPLITTLDVNMPGMDGFEAARRIRAQNPETYLIMITALHDEADVVLGLSAGADDFIHKPFRPREFRARIEALLRRPRAPLAPAPRAQESAGPSFPAGRQPATSSMPVAPAAPVPPTPAGSGDVARIVEQPAAVAAAPDGAHWMTHRDLRLDPDSRVVLVGDEELELTRTEFDLLAALMESRRRVRSKADLTLLLRGESYVTTYFVGDADKRAIEAHMTNLRRKLGDNAASPRYIETVRGVGYRLTSDGSAY